VDGKAPAAQFAANVLIQAAGEMSLDAETNIGLTIIEAKLRRISLGFEPKTPAIMMSVASVARAVGAQFHSGRRKGSVSRPTPALLAGRAGAREDQFAGTMSARAEAPRSDINARYLGLSQVSMPSRYPSVCFILVNHAATFGYADHMSTNVRCSSRHRQGI
jgi:hypothetical protein